MKGKQKSQFPDIMQYYATQGVISDPGEYKALFNRLPDDIPQLVKVVPGLMLHMLWADRYGVNLSKERLAEADLRKVSRQLKRMMELDDSHLTKERLPANRLVGNCRDFSTLLTAILRHKGIPARARCGFATYFNPDHYEDHWVCQYWKADEARWVMTDAQLDKFQREQLGVKFDTTDLPEGQFLPAGQGWQICRAGAADPEKFGILDMHGMWFIRGNLVRDLLSLNKIELLPWDGWTLMPNDPDKLGILNTHGVPDIPLQDMELLDRIASLTLGMDKTFPE
ncbi:MAG: hypothetical protein A2Z28_06380, partial [Chloroflexi bacterium RBG_16_51_9]